MEGLSFVSRRKILEAAFAHGLMEVQQTKKGGHHPTLLSVCAYSCRCLPDLLQTCSYEEVSCYKSDFLVH